MTLVAVGCCSHGVPECRSAGVLKMLRSGPFGLRRRIVRNCRVTVTGGRLLAGRRPGPGPGGATKHQGTWSVPQSVGCEQLPPQNTARKSQSIEAGEVEVMECDMLEKAGDFVKQWLVWHCLVLSRPAEYSPAMFVFVVWRLSLGRSITCPGAALWQC